MKIAFLTLTVFSIILTSCERSGSGKCTETNISTAARASHNRGEDCSSCHTSGGQGRGCFQICGSAFESNKSTPMQNAVMVLFTRNKNGDIKDSLGNFIGVSKPISLDKTGNFYTTESTNFLDKSPAIIHKGDTIIMGGTLSSGNCNSCHSTKGSQEPIYSYK